jgi:hypothetical protein
VVGGATSVLTLALDRRRGAALVVALAALVAYGAAAASLPDVSTNVDAVVISLIVLPAYTLTIWLALPLWRTPFVSLLFGALSILILAFVLDFLGVDALGNVLKLVGLATLGFWLLSLFDELWWVTLVAVLIPWVDIWSVATGPTKYVTQEQPNFFNHVSVAFPLTGQPASINIGPPDIIFFALFLAAADRFRLRPNWTWLGMTAFLSLTVALVWWLADSGLPALPAVSLGFLLPNADRIWRHVSETWRARKAAHDRSASLEE